jgi:hypothetical protein
MPDHYIEEEVEENDFRPLSPGAIAAIKANMFKVNPLANDAFKQIKELTNASRRDQGKPDVTEAEIQEILQLSLQTLNLLNGHIPAERLAERAKLLSSSLNSGSIVMSIETDDDSQTSSSKNHTTATLEDGPELEAIRQKYKKMLDEVDKNDTKKRNAIAAQKCREIKSFRIKKGKYREESPDTIAINEEYDVQLEDVTDPRQRNTIAVNRYRALQDRLLAKAKEAGVPLGQSEKSLAIKADCDAKLQDETDRTRRTAIIDEKNRQLKQSMLEELAAAGIIRRDSPKTGDIKRKYAPLLQGATEPRERNRLLSQKTRELESRRLEKANAKLGRGDSPKTKAIKQRHAETLDQIPKSNRRARSYVFNQRKRDLQKRKIEKAQEMQAGPSGTQFSGAAEMQTVTFGNQFSEVHYEYHLPNGSKREAQDLLKEDGTREAYDLHTYEKLGPSQMP